MYEAQLSISCVDGMVEGIQGSDVSRILEFLEKRDHEGSSVSLLVRDTPSDKGYVIESGEKVYAFLKESA